MDIIILLIDATARKACLDEISGLEIRLLSLWNDYELDIKIEQTNILSGNSTNRKYSDDSLTLAILHFSSAAMLLSHALEPLGNPPKIPFRLVDASKLALECIKYLETRAIGCAYLRMMLPLFLIMAKSASKSQRQQAFNTLESWKSKGIMPGLCMLAENSAAKQYS
jgi:hypothetical protein